MTPQSSSQLSTQQDKLSWLLYGLYGSGKTATAVSAFWDWKRQKLIRDGRWLLFGREENKALHVPEKYIKRFVSPAENPLRFVEEFEKYMRAVVFSARKGGTPEVFVFDGFTEWNALFLSEHLTAKGDTGFARFGEAKDRFFQFMQFINPEELRAHVIGTARVDEKKRGVKSKTTGEVVGADPDFIDFKHIPNMTGWARNNLGNYFGMVLYVDSDPGKVKLPDGRIRDGELHKVYFLPTEDTNAYVKNWYSWAWQLSSLPNFLTNPTFDDMLASIKQAETEAAASMVGR